MILCATDFSASARSATSTALWLARRFDDSIVLLHVLESIPLLPDVNVASAAWVTIAQGAADAQLEKAARELRESGVRVAVRTAVGDPAALILQEAAQGQASFITMGTHGRTGAAHLFLGSVAERVTAEAGCPVIVTRDRAEASWPATRPLNLAVVNDGSPLAGAALDWAAELRRVIPCDLTVVRLYSPPREAARYGLEEPWLGRGANPALLALLERDQRRDLGRLAGDPSIRIRFATALVDPAEDLAGELTLLQADAVVVAVGKHRSTWPAPTTAAVLRRSPAPVICVPWSIRPQVSIGQVRAVLVPATLEGPPQQALSTACALLRPHGGRIELLHVHERGPGGSAAAMRLPLPLDDDERSEIEARLRALVPAEAGAMGIATSASVIDGTLVAETIVQGADRLGVDMIVMATRGRGGLRRALLGSVAEEVARTARKPVVLVHEPGGGH